MLLKSLDAGKGIADVEKETVRRARKGDRAAFDQIVALYHDRVYNWAYVSLSRREDAEDAALEVFLRVYRALPRFRGESDFGTWLYTIAARTIPRFFQRGPWTEPLDDFEDILPDDADDPAQEAVKTELHRCVRRAVRSLPAKYREVIVLYFLEEQSYQDIQAILGISRNQMYDRLNRGKALLYQQLKPLYPELVEEEERKQL
jgi:RNA polymerase sigma-70 factor (ECF subfamily)